MRKFKFRKIWILTKAIKLVNFKAGAQDQIAELYFRVSLLRSLTADLRSCFGSAGPFKYILWLTFFIYHVFSFIHSFLRLNNISLYGYTIFCLSVHQLMGIWVEAKGRRGCELSYELYIIKSCQPIYAFYWGNLTSQSTNCLLSSRLRRGHTSQEVGIVSGGSHEGLHCMGPLPSLKQSCSHIEGFPTGPHLGPGSHFKGTILLPEHLDIAYLISQEFLLSPDQQLWP